jgi:hypothetical protein
MSEPSRMPGLTLPFTVVGGAAGWLSAGFLANPLVGFGDPRVQSVAAGLAAGVAAAIGALLTRWCARRMDWHPPSTTWFRLVVVVVLGGALVGGAVTGIESRTTSMIAPGLLEGALCSLAFLPVCGVVLFTAKRAERARMGSLVAGADRRAVWGILVTALAVTTVAAAIDWRPPGPYDVYPHRTPWAAIGMLGGAGLLIAAFLQADRAALARVREAAAAPGFEQRHADDGALALPRLDLGLGDEVRAELARGATAYRSRARPVALLLGSPDEASAALRRSIARGLVGLGVVGTALAAHGAAAAWWR